MDRKKFGVVLVALMTGVALSVGSVWAQAPDGLAPRATAGYLMGDPAPGKLIPYFKVSPTLATIIGIENAEEDASLSPVNLNLGGEDVQVHVTVFNKSSVELLNLDLCMSPLDFGYIVLQKGAPTAAQIADLNKDTSHGGQATTRGSQPKAIVLSVDTGDIATEGYVSVRAVTEFGTNNGTCGNGFTGEDQEGFIPDGIAEPLATWAILLDVGSGFFATEIPTPTAIVDIFGDVFGGAGAFGLIPGPIKDGSGKVIPDNIGAFGHPNAGNIVFARYDVNPTVGSHTDIFVWLANNSSSRANWFALLDCEDELQLSTRIDLSHEVNVIDPDTLSGIGQCKFDKQYRGVLRFQMPDTGFLWSHISQDSAHFVESFLGYNLENNAFIDCAPGDDFDDFHGSADYLCPNL